MIYPSEARIPAVRPTVVMLAAVLPLLGAPVPAPAQEARSGAARHTVRPGDTLWQLAARYLDDPYAWEELYRLNREQIEDPDRIYPGQRLQLPVTGEAAGRVPAAGRRPSSREGGEQADPFAGPTVFDEGGSSGAVTASFRAEAAEASPLVSASDFYRAPWVGSRRVDPAGSVVRVVGSGAMGLELPPTVRVRDRVVLALTSPDVQPGALLQALRTGRPLGDRSRVLHPVGLVEVDEVMGDSARARVTALFGRFEVGAPLVTAPDLPERGEVRTVPARDSMRTRVVAAERQDHPVAGESFLFLDAPASGEIVPGDEFALYEGGVERSPVRRPEDWVAVVRVLRITPRAATARVVELRDIGAGPGSPAIRIRRPHR